MEYGLKCLKLQRHNLEVEKRVLEEKNSTQMIKQVEIEIKSITKSIDLLELSERQESTETSYNHDSKALHIADVVRSFDVDFNKHTRVRINVDENNNIQVTAAINGWGDVLDLNKITIKEIVD